MKKYRPESDRSIQWLRLTACIALTTILSLSVHVVMLDILGIPHPDNNTIGTAAILANEALSATATIAFYRIARSSFERFSLVGRCMLLTLIYAMLGEALLRSFIMGVVVSHDWIYCLVESLSRPIEYFIVCVIIVVVAPRARTPWMMVAAGIAIAAVSLFIVNPPIEWLSQRLIASVEFLDTGNIYNPPYGWQVDVPSYLTWLEPVIASYAIAALVLDRLSLRLGWRLAQFVVLISAMKRSILPTVLYSFYQPRPLPEAILSESQFMLEILALAILTAAGWAFSTQGRNVRP